MRLSINSEAVSVRYGDECAIEMLGKAGFDCIDYTFIDGKSIEMYGDNYKEYVQKLLSLLKKYRMTCNQAHAPYDFKYGGAFEMSNEKYAKLVRSIEAASMLGADNIVVHTISVPDDVDVFAYNIEFFKSLQPYCEKFKICVAIENLYEYDAHTFSHFGRLHTPELLNAMIAELNSPWFTICVDVGHAAITNNKPQDVIRGFDNRVLKALHIHDTDYRFDRHTLPYTGQHDWEKIMKALKSIDYTGDLTYEIGHFMAKYPDDLVEDALFFAEKTGRSLIRSFEKCTE